MKICVYAIAKNEEQFAPKWVDSMQEADGIYVLDTGSTDHTAELLRERGAIVVSETVVPWRFDTARNRSLKLVPEDTDICVCTDLDEVFHPGWRSALEAAWTPGAGQARYRYTWSFLPDGKEGVVFWPEKIHARHGYRWVHPVHEVLIWTGETPPGPTITAAGVQLDHHPDPKKSRSQYLPLLELSVQEDPEDDRNMHYLGREYFFHRRWDDCIATLRRHLTLPRATWADERAASMRYIGRAYAAKGKAEEATRWLLRAVAEAPYLREPACDLAMELYREENWEGVLFATDLMLQITERPMSYICEAAPWGSLPHDLRCIAFYRTGRIEQALNEARAAVSLEPDNPRLQENLRLLEEMCGS